MLLIIPLMVIEVRKEDDAHSHLLFAAVLMHAQIFTHMLHMVPRTVVETRKEVEGAKGQFVAVVLTHAQVFTRMLHMIPLTVVETRKEVDDVKELVSICRNYHIALRCELKRKVGRWSICKMWLM